MPIPKPARFDGPPRPSPVFGQALNRPAVWIRADYEYCTAEILEQAMQWTTTGYVG
jgi:hypothetical protein